MNIPNRLLLALVSASCLLTISGFSAEPVAATETLTVLTRDLNSRVVRNQSGGTYTILADGLCYEENGTLKDSEDLIELAPGGNGAAATKGRHKASFQPNITSPVTVDLPNGGRWIAKPYCLAYFDALSGNSVLIAELADSVGELHPPNMVLYPRAFPEAAADIRYTYRRGSFAQDVVIRARLPDPALWNFSPAFTRIECWSEILESPTIAKTAEVVSAEQDPDLRLLMEAPDVIDETITLGGAMQIGRGKAFPINDADTSIPVSKQLLTILGRTFLVETIEYPAAEPILNTLRPADQANADIWKKRKAHPRAEVIAAVRPKRPEQRAEARVMQIAKNVPAGPALVADYDLYHTVSYTNFTFAADRTFMLDGILTLAGTTTLEPAIIKFSSYNASYPAYIKISGTGSKINCLTTPYRPCVFTASTDQSVGETVTSGSPSGYYATHAIYFDSSADANSFLHDIRIRYANTGIYYTSGSSHILRHSQLVGCNKALEGGMSTAVRVQNCLVGGYTAINGYLTVRGENLTVAAYSLGGSSVPLTNCLLNLGTSGSYSGVSNYAVTGSAFSALGAGNYYLADNTYRNAGTTAIDPDLASDLKSRTTYPPMLLTGDFTLPTTLSPQAQRDVDLPDCGYHFDPIDYAWSTLALSTTLVLTNGVAVAIYGTNGTILQPGAKFISEGHPLRMNRIVRYGAVQDGSLVWGTSGSSMSLFNLTNSGATLPEIRMRFTDVSLLADTSTEQYVIDTANVYTIGVLAFTDCHLRGGYINLANHGTNAQTATMAFTNNFFQRVNFTFRQNYNSDTTPAPLYFWNNLVIGSALTLQGGSQSSPYIAWEARDNFLDAVTLSASTFANSRNAYTGATTLPGSGGNDHTNLVPNYATSTLGTNYYGTSTPLSNLINTGSRNRDVATLFHHTVLVAQTTEGADTGSAVVDIGFHFIALSSGLPKDSDGDGIPDFVENRNGTGTYNSGTDPSDWNSYTSPNGLTGTPGLQVFTPLK